MLSEHFRLCRFFFQNPVLTSVKSSGNFPDYLLTALSPTHWGMEPSPLVGWQALMLGGFSMAVMYISPHTEVVETLRPLL